MQSQVLCIAQTQGQYLGCREVWEDWEEVVRHSNIVFSRYSPDEPYAGKRRKPYCCDRGCIMAWGWMRRWSRISKVFWSWTSVVLTRLTVQLLERSGFFFFTTLPKIWQGVVFIFQDLLSSSGLPFLMWRLQLNRTREQHLETCHVHFLRPNQWLCGLCGPCLNSFWQISLGKVCTYPKVDLYNWTRDFAI